MVSVAVLAGGPSAEHAVSLQTGSEVLGQLRAGGIAARPVFLSRSNAWSFGEPAQDFAELDAQGGGGAGAAAARHTPRAALPLDEALAALAASGEVAYLGLHGRFGEDGQLQQLLEARGIPFTGSGSQSSRIGMDKVLSKQAAARLGARCAPHTVVLPGSRPEQALLEMVGLPCIAKPVRGGSSVGVTRVQRADELAGAVERAATEDEAGRALLEGFIDGVEVTCGVLRAAGAVRTLPLIAIRPAGGGLYDYHAKYVAEDTGFECPARIPKAAVAEIERISAALYAALELRGVARMDFIVRRADGAATFLELNTLPGFTSHSLVPRAAAVAGYSRLDVLQAVLGDTGARA